MIKRRVVAIEIAFFLTNLLAVYIAMALALRGDFILSYNNSIYAIIHGIFIGLIVAFITAPLLSKSSKNIQLVGIAIGIVAQFVTFSGFYIYVSIGAIV